MSENSTSEDTSAKPRWSRILLWPGAIILGLHGIFAMQFDVTTDIGALQRLLAAASVLPILAQALLTAGLIALVLEETDDRG
ncbi:hypothetical protein [Saccharopolyspora sp. 5N708]|uniref:hypothetical protein n=1 Tax=Saccharopolyspora sp. 5N708 TaxID=3457424 RepID=UPI003FCF26CE